MTKEVVLRTVIECATEMLRERTPDPRVGEESAFADIGIDSLSLVMLFVRLEESLAINLQELGAIDRDLVRIRDVADLLAEKFGPEGIRA